MYDTVAILGTRGHHMVTLEAATVEARKLEYDRPLLPKQRKNQNQHKTPYIPFQISWSLLYTGPAISELSESAT